MAEEFVKLGVGKTRMCCLAAWLLHHEVIGDTLGETVSFYNKIDKSRQLNRSFQQSSKEQALYRWVGKCRDDLEPLTGNSALTVAFIYHGHFGPTIAFIYFLVHRLLSFLSR